LKAKYEIISEIGRGGMGVVYQGTQVALNRTVAIKTLPAEIAQDQNYIDRIKKEAVVLAKLQHPNIVYIIDIEVHSSGVYLIMEYISGKTLAQLLKEQTDRRFDFEKAKQIARDVASALKHAHEHGIIHRDIKSANIMISDEGSVKITDFGIARVSTSLQVTKTGLIQGTPRYMSPEQIKGEKDIDGRADIYSLGIVFYELLTGYAPFTGNSEFDILEKHLKQIPARPSSFLSYNLSEAYENIILTCIAKDKESRFQTAGDLIDAIDRLDQREDKKFSMPAEGFTDDSEILENIQPESLLKSKTTPFWAAGGALFLIILGLFSYLMFKSPKPPGPEPDIPTLSQQKESAESKIAKEAAPKIASDVSERPADPALDVSGKEASEITRRADTVPEKSFKTDVKESQTREKVDEKKPSELQAALKTTPTESFETADRITDPQLSFSDKKRSELKEALKRAPVHPISETRASTPIAQKKPSELQAALKPKPVSSIDENAEGTESRLPISQKKPSELQAALKTEPVNSTDTAVGNTEFRTSVSQEKSSEIQAALKTTPMKSSVDIVPKKKFTLNTSVVLNIRDNPDTVAVINDFLSNQDLISDTNGGDYHLMFTVDKKGRKMELRAKSSLLKDHAFEYFEESFTVADTKALLETMTSLIKREYCFNLLNTVYLYNTGQADYHLNLAVEGGKRDAIKIGDTIDICMHPNKRSHFMMFGVDLYGIYRIYPLPGKKHISSVPEKDACMRNIEVAPPAGNELLFALATTDKKILTELGRVASDAIFSELSYDGPVEENAVSFCERLFSRLVETATGKWTASGKFLRSHN
jgi:serine/threonine protein kinase